MTKSRSNRYPGFKVNFIKAASPVKQNHRKSEIQLINVGRDQPKHTSKKAYITLVVSQMFSRKSSLCVTIDVNTNYNGIRRNLFNNT